MLYNGLGWQPARPGRVKGCCYIIVNVIKYKKLLNIIAGLLPAIVIGSGLLRLRLPSSGWRRNLLQLIYSTNASR